MAKSRRKKRQPITTLKELSVETNLTRLVFEMKEAECETGKQTIHASVRFYLPGLFTPQIFLNFGNVAFLLLFDN